MKLTQKCNKVAQKLFYTQCDEIIQNEQDGCGRISDVLVDIFAMDIHRYISNATSLPRKTKTKLTKKQYKFVRRSVDHVNAGIKVLRENMKYRKHKYALSTTYMDISRKYKSKNPKYRRLARFYNDNFRTKFSVNRRMNRFRKYCRNRWNRIIKEKR